MTCEYCKQEALSLRKKFLGGWRRATWISLTKFFTNKLPKRSFFQVKESQLWIIFNAPNITFFQELLILCVRQNVYYLRHFSVPRVLRCPTGIDRGCQVTSDFRRRLGLTDTLGLDLMLLSIRCQTSWIKASFIWSKVVPGKRVTLVAEATLPSDYMRKKLTALPESRAGFAMTTLLAHALLVSSWPSWPG